MIVSSHVAGVQQHRPAQIGRLGHGPYEGGRLDAQVPQKATRLAVAQGAPCFVTATITLCCRDTFLGIIRHHNPKLASRVDVIYALSQAWVMTESDSDFEMLEKRLADLNPDELILVCGTAVHTQITCCSRIALQHSLCTGGQCFLPDAEPTQSL